MEFIADIVQVFVTALFPPIFFCACGAVADRFLEFDLRTLSRLLVYICVPALLFSSLMQVEVTADEVLRVAGFVLIILCGMAGAAWLYAWCWAMDSPTTSGTILSVTFFNAVNLGFPVLLYAFGEEGLHLAGVLVAVISVPHNAFGLFLAAWGQMSARQTVRTLLRMPMLYALALAVVLRATGAALPEIVFQPIDTLGRAGIPLVLVLVGMELSRIELGAIEGRVAGVVALRLLFAPLLAWAAASLVGLSGLLRTVVILQASMPSAVMPIVYARQFGGNVSFVSRAVFYSTLCSLLTLPILLWWLR